jgi:adenosylcobyric acid synthase
MSNVGKSIIATGLCRLFLQDGYRVAPFKSQNMSLNSFVTADGGEMGRAQVVQAEACRLAPDVAMNPILLKPITDRGSQVIVWGQHWATLEAQDYFARRGSLRPAVRRAFDWLAEHHDIIVVEGAGSPAEINLRQDDIVNMGLAKQLEAPVLLVGDIDRGGVFAQLYGTCALLPPDERRLVKGLIINKFRGQEKLLRDGLVELERLTDRPVLGVVPWLDLEIDDEDSLAERLDRDRPAAADDGAVTDEPGAAMMGEASPVPPPAVMEESGVGAMSGAVGAMVVAEPGGPPASVVSGPLAPVTAGRRAGSVDVAVVRLPKLSNFSDFTALSATAGVEVRYVDRPDRLGRPDLLILPGSRNTMADLAWLRRRGLDQAVLAQAAAGRPLMGLCGGYQMLGRVVEDPAGVESGGRSAGLGLLPVATRLRPAKRQTRVEGVVLAPGGPLAALSGAPLAGYEIHLGATTLEAGAQPLVGLAGGAVDGCWRGSVYGTYLHGFFDSQPLRSALLAALGRPAAPVVDLEAHKEAQYDHLANTLRQTLDIDRIYRLMGVER